MAQIFQDLIILGDHVVLSGKEIITEGNDDLILNPGGAGVKLVLGEHPIADQLRALGLAEATPILSVWTEHMTGSFGPAAKLA